MANVFVPIIDKTKLNRKIKFAKELEAAKQRKLNEEKMFREQELLERKEALNRPYRTKSSIFKENEMKLKEARITFLKEFAASISYGALPIDSDMKEPMKDKIKDTVYDYFESNANGTLMSSIARLSNNFPINNQSIMGNTRIDNAAMAIFNKTNAVDMDSWQKMDAPHGRVTALDFINITDAKYEADVVNAPWNKALKKMTESAIKVVKDKVVAALKEEAEISQYSNFLKEGLQTDPDFEMKFKHMKRQAHRNTIFKEVCKNVYTLNEGVNTGTTDEYMAEAILQLTIMETMNTLFLENLTPHERINKLYKERQAHLATLR